MKLARLLLVMFCLLANAITAAESLPNFVVILTDDQGRGDYGAFGTPDIQTPNIDRLFRQGMEFKNFYANSCVCSPTRAALLTGRYPDRAGVPGVIREENPANSWGWLSPEIELLPALLKKKGYATALVGKWHLGLSAPNIPTQRGFEYFHGFLGDMMDDYYTHRRNGLNLMREDEREIDPEGHATDLFSQWACDYIHSRKASLKPFFLYLAFNAPHDPVQPPRDWLEKVRRREPGISEARARLVALIEHMDHGLGRVISALAESGLATNTVVVFTSDNGGVLQLGARNGPYRAGKGVMFEGGLRVPAAVVWPPKVAPGSTTSQVAATMDIFSTILDIAGAGIPNATDGVSLVPALLGKPRLPEARTLYFVRREGGGGWHGKAMEALRQDQWKLVQPNPFAPFELYDLSNDPEEEENLAGSQPAKMRELLGLLSNQVQKGGRVPWQAPRKE